MINEVNDESENIQEIDTKFNAHKSSLKKLIQCNLYFFD